MGSPPLLELEEVSGRGGQVNWGRWLLANVAGQTRYAVLYRRAGIKSPRRMAGRPSAAAFTARERRCVRERRRCAEDETMRTMTAHSCRQIGATRRAGIFFAFLRAFLSSGVPERAPEGWGWPGLTG
jgi:hypothetical protein